MLRSTGMWRLSHSLTAAHHLTPSTTLCCVSVLIILPLFFFCPFVSPLLFLFCCRSLSFVSQNPSPHRGNYAGICETICYDFSGCAHIYLQRYKTIVWANCMWCWKVCLWTNEPIVVTLIRGGTLTQLYSSLLNVMRS